jgi:hypothetical protein
MLRARLIPTSGIGSEKEAEQRATSALLAILTVVRDLSVELFSPLGASRAQKATVDAWTEVQFGHNGKRIRPDGMLQVAYGKSTWTALVEVKTGDATLDADQINNYWDVARGEKFDHVITVSNEIAPNADTHPTPGLRVRSNSPVQVTHLSWTAILTTAVRLKQHKGVDDPEQAFLLGELIRYLEHPSSGAMAFSDMGPNWVAVRDGARAHALAKKDDGVEDVVARWDQLIRYAALKLGSEIGEDVIQVLSKAHRDPKARQAHLVEQLCGPGTLDGALRIPNTAGDLEILADLRAQQLVASLTVTAPQDKGAVGRVSWLVNQLKDVNPSVVLEAYPKNAKTGPTTTLRQALEDRQTLIGDDKREAFKFRVVWRRDMGMPRKSGGKNPGFIDTVLGLIDAFYGEIVQNITPWVPPAPKIKRPAQLSQDANGAGPESDHAGIDLQPSWRPSTAGEG